MLTPAPANAPDAKVRQQKTNGNGERIAELFKYKAAVQYNSNRCRIRLFPLEKQHLKLQGPPQQPEAQPVKMSATPNRRLSHVPTQLAGKALPPLAPSGKLSWHRFRTSFFFFFPFSPAAADRSGGGGSNAVACGGLSSLSSTGHRSVKAPRTAVQI